MIKSDLVQCSIYVAMCSYAVRSNILFGIYTVHIHQDCIIPKMGYPFLSEVRNS